MNRTFSVAATLLALAAASPAGADTVNRAAAVGGAAVNVVNPLTVTQTQGLDFGTITSGAAGTVSIYPVADTRGVTGGVGAVASDPGQPGAFLVTGSSNAEIQIVVGLTIGGFSGGISGVTRHSPLLPRLQGATQAFTVGGTLSIPANTPAGHYTGAYLVTVSYP